MKPDYTNARSADGPMVVAYLRKLFPYLRTTKWETGEDPFIAAVLSWDRADRLVCVYTLDRWLAPNGITLSELPEDCWRWSSPKTRVKDRQLCELVIGEYMEGGRSPGRLARAYGFSRQTVAYWTRDLMAA